MEEKIKELVDRIRELREIFGYTPEELADELGIPAETYRSYESEGDNIPINVIFQLANKYGVDFNEILTGESGKLDTYHVVRRGTGKKIKRYLGYDYKDLAFRYGNKIMQPLLVMIEPSDERTDLTSHAGQEFNFVLEGKLKVAFDDKEIILEEGDSIYFNATHKHGQSCIGNDPVVFLVVIAE